MVSKQLIDMMDLKVTVYGLEEYKQLPKGTPIGVMLACPGMGQTQKHLEKLCTALCGLNNDKTAGSRYIMVATVDQPYQGTRARKEHQVYYPTSGLYDQPHFGLETHSSIMKTSLTFSCLIDSFETCVFGAYTSSLVDKWGVIGFSMGGYSALQAGANDPRISVTISICSTPDPVKLFRGTVKALKLEEDFYVSKRFKELVNVRYNDIHNKYRHTHLLMINGGKDVRFPSNLNDEFFDKLRQNRLGVEGSDFKSVTVPEGDHFICKGYIVETLRWTNQWMCQPSRVCEARL